MRKSFRTQGNNAGEHLASPAFSSGLTRGFYLGNFLGGALVVAFGLHHPDKFPPSILAIFATAMVFGAVFYLLDSMWSSPNQGS